MVKEPQDCQTMTDIRAGIDSVDAELMAMLARRTGYIRRAAEIKDVEKIPARVDWRVEEVAMNARRNAEAAGFDADLAEKLWRQLIDWSIDLEAVQLGEKLADPDNRTAQKG